MASNQRRLHRSRVQPLLVRVLVLLTLTGLLVSGCSPAVRAMRAPNPLRVSGDGAVTHAGFTATSDDPAQTVTLAPPTLNQDAFDSLVSWAGNGTVVGTPVEVTLDGGLPDGGVTLTRTFPIAIPEDVAVTFVYWDDVVGEWWAVPSDISPDRLSVSATVDHLSFWTTITGGAQDALQGFTAGLSAAGTVIKDAADTANQGVQQFNNTVKKAFVAAAEEGYYAVGKIFDVRVDAPTCDGDIPDWADSTTFIETHHRSNPVLWCAGHDTQHPELLVVKARVNRGYGSFAETAATPAWTYNSTFDQGAFDTALAAITELDQTLAQSVTELTGGGRLVGPGQEISFGFSEDAVRAVEVGQPLVTLALPGIDGFLATSIAQAVTQSGEMLLEGSLAAVIGVASCSTDLAGVDDIQTASRAAITCISGFDDLIAQKVALGLLTTGMSPQAAGKAAGATLAKFTVWLALIGPVFNIMNYTADSMLPDSARTLTVFVTITRPATNPTEVIVLNPFTADGTLKAGYTLDDLTTQMPVQCFSASRSAVTGGTHDCGGTADSTHSCWASPRYPGQVACMTTPWRAELLLRRAENLTATAAPDNPEPLGIELVDGTRWWLRHGGSWGTAADGRVGAYGCDSADCSYEQTGLYLAVVTLDTSPVIDESTPTWTVLVGELGSPDDEVPPPTRIAVAKAWFIASDLD